MFQPRTLLLVVLVLISLTWISSASFLKMKVGVPAVQRAHVSEPNHSAATKLTEKASAAKKFTTANGYNTSVCFLIDMSLPSGQNRFFVYDLKGDSVEAAALVTHGRCNENWLEGRKYGNTPGCGCTSLGKYRIGNNYNGRFGSAYKLYGLEKTNDKAFERFVVLHSHACVPGTEVPDEICQSDGCPTVSPMFLQQLSTVIKGSAKPVLLWIYP